MTSFTFECDVCGYREEIENPIKLIKKCPQEDCEGNMQALSIFPLYPKKRSRKDIEEERDSRKKEVPIVNPNDEPTTLMGLLVQGKKIEQPTRSYLAERMFQYKTVMCPHCGRIQVTQGEEMFKCRNDGCKKTSQFRLKGQWHVKLYDFATSEEAHIFAKRWAESEFMKDEERKNRKNKEF